MRAGLHFPLFLLLGYGSSAASAAIRGPWLSMESLISGNLDLYGSYRAVRAAAVPILKTVGVPSMVSSELHFATTMSPIRYGSLVETGQGAGRNPTAMITRS